MRKYHPGIIFRTVLFVLGLTVAVSPAQAFDDDFEINDIDLSKENFLDIKAHRFRKSLEERWYDAVSAWRITGASLNVDLAFIHTELKLQHALSDSVNVRLVAEQETFYADKEFPLPTTEVEIYPWAGNLGFSLLGTPAYGKRESDLGVALIWGRRPWNYVRFEYLDVDATYNEKNNQDDTFYGKEPIAVSLEGAYRFGEHYKLRFNVRHEKPLELIDPDNNSVFKHETDDGFLLLDYQRTPDSLIGITLKGFSLDKARAQTGQNERQETEYFSADVYWVQGMGEPYELRLGTQYDSITNKIRDAISNSNDLDYSMKTAQVYATAYHPFNDHMAWDLGLYAGQVEEERDFLNDSSTTTRNDGVETKFRLGFEYASSDGRSSLQLNISLNLDDPVNDPGDGAGISFQSVF